MMRTIWAVATKELLDLLRDRRSVLNIFVMGALVGPLMAVGMLSFTVNMVITEAKQRVTIDVIGAQNAPSLLKHLQQRGIDSRDLQQSLPQEVIAEQLTNRHYPLVLEIPDNFVATLEQGTPTIVSLHLDGSLDKSQRIKQRVESALAQYNAELASLRLLADGVDPALVQGLQWRVYDVAPNQNKAAKLLSLLPYFLIIGLIQAASLFAADTTAGERERKTLEPLLINPVPAEHIMFGKLLSNILVCLAVIAIACLAFGLAARLLPIAELGLKLEASSMLAVVGALTPLTLVISPLMTFLGAFARSVREAQTYLSFVIIAAIIPSVAQMIIQVAIADWQLLIPLWSHYYLINEFLRGLSIEPSQWLLMTGGSLLTGLLITGLAIRQYRRPSLIFSN